jgi:hypothetical protein
VLEDGYRVQLHIHNGAIKVLTRRGRRFGKIAADSPATWESSRETGSQAPHSRNSPGLGEPREQGSAG